MTEQITQIVITAVLMGGVTSITTVAVLKAQVAIHLKYLREAIDRIENDVDEMQVRIDNHIEECRAKFF